MKNCILLLMLLYVGKLHAINYYFSTSLGDDSRTAVQAQNPSSPWKTLAKLNAVSSTFNAGDSVLFMRGDVFTGSILLSKSGVANRPIVFADYGNGAYPVISGFTVLSSWVSLGNGIFETTSPSLLSTVNSLLINGKPTAIGRYPNAGAANKGYLNFESSIGNQQITDNQLPSSPDWTKGEVVIRKNRWVLDRNAIILHSGNTIKYTSGSPYSADPNFGYFIQNHPGTLDLYGEWYFNAATKKIGVFFGSVGPASSVVKASSITTLISLNNKNNITFNNISFQGANMSAFDINNSQNIAINNCEILFSGADAIDGLKADGVSVQNTFIYYTNNIALNFNNCSNSVVKNNKINCTGIFPGMGKGNSGSYEAVMMDGNNNLIELNQIDSTGYIPVTFSGNTITIKNNFISNFAFVKDDGGGIYTYNGSSNPKTNFARKIIGNIVLNGKGASAGTSDASSLPANGIYIDDKVNNVDVLDNTVANCGNYGIFLHNSNDILVQKNTVFNNKRQLGIVHDKIAPNNPIKNIRLLGNILFSKKENETVAEYKTIKNDLNNFGNFDSNYYCRPLNDNLVINSSYVNNGTYFSKIIDLGAWQAIYGKDKNSKKSPIKIAQYKINNLIGANLYPNGSFNTNTSGLYIWSAAGNSSVSWKNGILDGGSLQISFSKITGTSNRASVIIGIGTLTANKAYILKFSLKGTDEFKSLQVYLRKSLANYNDLSERKNVLINALRSENAIVFTASASDNNASIVFDVEEQSTPLNIDNIQLIEANVSANNPDQFMRLEYNPTSTTKTVAIDGTYSDVKNKIYTNSLVIAPFSSVILIRNDTSSPIPVSSCKGTGTITNDHWDNVAGNTTAAIPVGSLPSKTSQITSLEITNLGINYGTRIKGYICPPVTGNYTFFIAGDDAADLFLSTDNVVANKVKIAGLLSWTAFREWNKFPSQKSLPVYLKAGYAYYIEVLQKQGAGGDHVSVAWQFPDGTMETPISGSHLIPYDTAQVIKSNQVINFGTISAKTYGDPDFNLIATATSGLPVQFAIISGPATLSGITVKLTGTGPVVIEASQSGNGSYNAAISVRQSFTIIPAPNSTSCAATGSILLEQWKNVTGNNVSNIPLQSTPTTSGQIKILEVVNVGSNYGTRMRGYVCPPQDGSYSFFIAGDDAAELWLSTDNDPKNKVKIAFLVSYANYRQWNKFPSQTSSPISLKVGKLYYLEVLHKQGGGGDHVSVGWKLPNGLSELPMTATRVLPFVNAIVLGRSANTKINGADAKTSKKTGEKETLITYPNPSASFSTVEFNASESGEVKLVLLDVQGRVIREFFKGAVEVGIQKRFIISNKYLASGVYYIKLVTRTKTLSKKLIVEK